MSAEADHRSDPRRALLALYDEALPVKYGYFVRRGDVGAAEDLTSETFLAAMDAACKSDAPRISVPWLLGVAPGWPTTGMPSWIA